MGKSFEMEIKVGSFVTIGIGLIMLAILILGGTNNFLTRQNTYYVHFQSVDGLITGTKVVLSGIQVGTIEDIDFDLKQKNIRLTLKVGKRYEEWIRKDTMAEILSQGVLGDKFISLSTGTRDTEMLEPKAEIPARPVKDLAMFLNKGDLLMVSLNSIAGSLDRLIKQFESKNRSETFFDGMSNTAKHLSVLSKRLSEELDHMKLKSAMNHLNSIFEKINNGTGTIGALVNDPSLYYDAKALLGGANRNRIVRNLVRKTIKESDEAGADKAAEKEKK
ncbi:MAG: hypothetical protein A2583_02465 [Bdellovibrionales bacterium RIFOXYD1_FULL_53_11]|nr:MAG: hypothetical protein A2583_02465 [Bdellovibrionales bacterium RIFOXYD1_FULL_53_11]